MAIRIRTRRRRPPLSTQFAIWRAVERQLAPFEPIGLCAALRNLTLTPARVARERQRLRGVRPSWAPAYGYWFGFDHDGYQQRVAICRKLAGRAR